MAEETAGTPDERLVLKVGGFYINGRGDFFGPMTMAAANLWLDQYDTAYTTDGKVHNHVKGSAANLFSEVNAGHIAIKHNSMSQRVAELTAALTTQRDEAEQALKRTAAYKFDRDLKRLEDELVSAVTRAEAAEAQRDELQKRIGYTAVPSDSPCESPPAWVPVTERLPTVNGHGVLGYDERFNCIVGTVRFTTDCGNVYKDTEHDGEPVWLLWAPYDPEAFESAVVLEAKAISHWMPLPEGPAIGNEAATTLPTNGTEGLRAELDAAKRALAEMNAPEIHDFVAGVTREAAHQRDRWGADHDEGKTAEDWLWLVAYLATKAGQASRYGDQDKYLHHIITCAAACCNWHAFASGTHTAMRPGQSETSDAALAAKSNEQKEL